MGLSEAASSGGAVQAALQPIVPGYGPGDAEKSWSELGLDSFDLLSLRLAVEDRAGIEIADEDWVEAATPAALARLAAASPVPAQAGVTLAETVELGMPQMAASGLSESWLMKALGDWHWRMTGAAFESRPADIRDDAGNRLFPAFTRIRFVSSAPLASYEEGERLRIEAALSRYGSAIFLSRVGIAGENGRTIEAELMSSFARLPGSGELVRGEPRLPEPCTAPAHAEMPAFGVEYARRRLARDAPRPVLARAPYAVQPHYDINGLGLLYCAAFPMIADTCDARARARATAGTSTLARDICYFANADAATDLEWRLHIDRGDGLHTEASIVRGDGAVMALVTSDKAML